MAVDDLITRSFVLPVYLVNTVISKGTGDPVTDLTEQLIMAFKLMDDRFLAESSSKVLDSLQEQMQQLYHDMHGYGIYEVTISRRTWIILRLTAKEFSKSQDELLTLCLVQYLTR